MHQFSAAKELLSLETREYVYSMLAQQAPLNDVLEVIAESFGLMVPGAKLSFMQFDAESRSLSMVPSRHFSDAFTDIMQGVKVDPNVGTCGAAAHHHRLVITADIDVDPRWHSFREAANAEGVRACWSSPVITSQGELLGTFGLYYRRPTPLDDVSDNITGELREMAALVALAILKDRDNRHYSTAVESYGSLFRHHPDSLCELDLRGRIQRVNAKMEHLVGRSQKELVGQLFEEIIVPSSEHYSGQTVLTAISAGKWCQYEAKIRRTNDVLDLDITSVPLVVEGNIVGVTNTCRDISNQKKQEAELALLQQAIEASPNGISISDARVEDAPIIHVNKAFCQITGYSLEETLGQNLRFLQGEETSPAAVSVLRRAVETQTSCEVKLLNYRKDGTLLWTRMAIGPILDAAGECTHFIGTQQDITSEVNQAAKIAYQASYDSLTGLINRSAFDDRLEWNFQWCRQNERLMAVLHLDLDGFKAINDSLGYNVGNQLLVAVADRLQSLTGPHDALAYFSGDEFVMLVTDIADFSDVVTAAERILHSFESSFCIEGHDLHVSTSIGIADSDGSLHQARELLQHADKAVERAKWQGRNTWQWYRATESVITDEHIMLRHDLHAALRNDEFELYYQPIVDAHTGHVRSVEALIRWHHPTRGIVAPGIFIPIAEKTGQIIALGRWVLKQACQTFANLNAKGYRVGLVSVNISALQFHRDGFISEVQNVLAETGLPAEMLELEITESVLFNEAENVIAMLHVLREMKVAIAIDDFGTGFSSLGYLRDLPISKVKLDRTFIQNIAESPSDAAIVDGIITMAHKMDLAVVAEGIETCEQQQDMTNRECDLLQGFLFSRPVPLSDLVLLPEQLPAAD